MKHISTRASEYIEGTLIHPSTEVFLNCVSTGHYWRTGHGYRGYSWRSVNGGYGHVATAREAISALCELAPLA